MSNNHKSIVKRGRNCFGKHFANGRCFSNSNTYCNSESTSEPTPQKKLALQNRNRFRYQNLQLNYLPSPPNNIQKWKNQIQIIENYLNNIKVNIEHLEQQHKG